MDERAHEPLSEEVLATRAKFQPIVEWVPVKPSAVAWESRKL